MSSISSAANHPNAREYNRKTRKLLRGICSRHLSADGTPGWGYIIYRTTYTLESTILFPQVLALLNNYIRAGIDRELHECKRNNMDNPDPLPNDEVWRLHRPTVLDDRAEFDGLSPDGVRAHFESWVDGLGFNAYPEPYHEPWMDEEGPLRPSWPRYRACIVIDDEVLQLLADVPTEAEYVVKKSEYGYRGPWMWYVKMVEAWWDELDAPQGYTGWMKVSLFSLFELWVCMSEDMQMNELFGGLDSDWDNEVWSG